MYILTLAPCYSMSSDLAERLLFLKMHKNHTVHSQRGSDINLTLYCQSTDHSSTNKLSTVQMAGLVHQCPGHFKLTERIKT